MNLLQETARVVVEYIRNNPVPTNELITLLQTTYQALAEILKESVVTETVVDRPVPATPIRKSVTTSYVACLECGKRFKILKRHLNVDHCLTVEEYRTRWGLTADYPVVAPDYTKRRSTLAYQMGLGTRRKKGKSIQQHIPEGSSLKVDIPTHRSLIKSNNSRERVLSSRQQSVPTS